MRLFNGPLGQFIKKHRLIRRTAFFGGLAVGVYFIGVAAGWWPNVLAGG
tara:strand:+ start:3175 stop:3321 length:147 start_codon:yes stop_codon:yes gene_type:complete